MGLAKPTIVIFDMDGTTVRHINPWILHVLEKLDDAYFWLSRVFTWIFERGGKGPPIPDEEAYNTRKKPRLLVHRALHKVRRKEVDQIVEPCPGIYWVLDLLKSHNIPLCIASNGLGKGYGHDILEKFELAPYFESTVFREDIHKSKPNPEGILSVLNTLKTLPQKDDVIWYIGDRHKDVLAALAAAQHLPCTVVPIAYGMNAGMAALKKGLGPDHIIMSFFDMHVILGRLLKKRAPHSIADKGS